MGWGCSAKGLGQRCEKEVYQSEGLKPRFDKSVFKKLLEISTSGIFMYRDKLFRQTDGVSMGSPLSPTLANFV